MASSVRLDRLINEVDVFDRPTETRRIDVTKITDDSRKVEPGTLFFCVPGFTRDGHDLAPEAVSKGAVAVVVEKELDVNVPQIRVSNVRIAMALIAAEFYGHPDRHLRIAGVTGTNGKTSTTQILTALLGRYKWKSASVGSLSGGFATPTTPPAIELQAALDGFRKEHVQAVAMEVSSHGLVQHRVDAIRFDVGVFTNLSHEHLDFHGTMNHYFEAKAMLFDPGRCEKAVINVDDEWGRKLVDRVAIPVIEYSLKDAKNLEIGAGGSRFEWNDHQVNLNLVGKFNVYNALAAATAARSMGVPVKEIVTGLNAVQPVPGRMETIDAGQNFKVFVDYAHKAEALENVLTTGREAAKLQGGRLIVVFGCGGDRDTEKRPMMGATAEKLADLAVVTNDNPRTEDPSAIVEQIMSGVHDRSRIAVELDRRIAISRAVSAARENDVVIIAGKGNEDYQEVNGVKHSFDDRLVAREEIQAALAKADQA